MSARWPQHHAVAMIALALIVGPRWPLLLPLLAAATWISQPRRGWATIAVLALLAAAVGGSWRMAEARTHALAPIKQGSAVGPNEPVEVQENAEQALDGRWKTTVRLRGATVELRTPVSARAPALRTGQRVRVRGTLRPVGEQALGARARGIALTLDATILGRAGRRGGWRGVIDRLRDRAERSLTTSDLARTALLRGMVLGQDDAFSAPQEDAYRRSGLSHLVAASGQNVALVAAMVVVFCALLGLRRRWRLGWAIVAVAVYVPLAGAGPSIRRAGVMGVLTLLALALGRAADRWWALLLSAIATVLVDPFAPQQLGWQLSFAAVVGLLLLVDPLAAVARRAGWPGWAGAAAAVPLGAGLATAPVLAASVGDVSLTSLGANLIVEPVVAPITWLGMLAGVLGPQGAPVTGALVAATGPPLDWVNGVAGWAAAPSWAVIQPGPAAAVLPVAAVLAGIVIVARPGWMVRVGDRMRRWAVAPVGDPATMSARRRRRRPRRLLGRRLRRRALAVAAVLIVVLGAGIGWAARPGGTHRSGVLHGDGVVVLDVGQGSATLLRQDGATILIDAGPAGGHVLDRLAEQGVERLDALVLSHAAADHTGGAPAVVQRLRPALLVDGRSGHADPPTATAAALVLHAGGQVVPARAGLKLQIRSLTAELRWPPLRRGPAPAGEDANDRAAVVRATVDGVRVLVPSDREGVPLRTAAGGPVDLLVLPHHGSEDPDVPRLLETLRPRVAVAQVGLHNGYGHPAPETVRALQTAHVPLWRTDRDGSVAVTAGPDGGTAPTRTITVASADREAVRIGAR